MLSICILLFFIMISFNKHRIPNNAYQIKMNILLSIVLTKSFYCFIQLRDQNQTTNIL